MSIANMPPIAPANQPANAPADNIAQLLDDLRHNVRNDMAQILVGFRHDFRNDLKTRADARDFNAIARGWNSTVNRPEWDLHPLKDRNTNEDIEEFPRTVGDIDRMNARDIGRVLRALGQSCQGGMPEKRRRLKIAIGIVLQAA
ncbi:hypothetical protein RB593_007192 [Gaeumannomyces tritici]